MIEQTLEFVNEGVTNNEDFTVDVEATKQTKTTKKKFDPVRRLKRVSDGAKAISYDGKLHSWDEPALILPDGTKEYYLYGVKYTRDQWEEFRRDRVGVPPAKNPLFKDMFHS